MQSIILHTPAPDNGGARRDAGETLAIGSKPGEIARETAQALLASGSAVAVARGPAAGPKTARRPRARILPDAASDEAE